MKSLHASVRQPRHQGYPGEKKNEHQLRRKEIICLIHWGGSAHRPTYFFSTRKILPIHIFLWHFILYCPVTVIVLSSDV